MIVCGLGQVGYHVSKLLIRLGETVTVIAKEARSEFVLDVTDLGGKVIIGDARDKSMLIESGILEAKALISVTSADLTNIEVALDAQVLNPSIRVIARLFDQTLAKRLEKSVGIHKALAMSQLAAPSFAAASINSDVIGSFEFDGDTFSVHQDGQNEIGIVRTLQAKIDSVKRRKRRISFRTFIQGIPVLLKWLFIGIIVLSVFSILVFCSAMNLSIVDSMYFVITTLTTTGYGDITVKDASYAVKLYTCLLMILGSAAVAILYSIITDFYVSARFAEILGRQQVADKGHIIVVGLGNVGFRVSEALVKLGHSVVVIDSNPSADNRGLLGDSVTFISGDGRDDETLRLAGVETAASIIAATHDDTINLSTCLVAKGLNSNIKSVVQLFDGNFARKVESALDIDTALSASRISAPGFVGAAIYENSVFSFVINEEFMTVIPAEGGFTFLRKNLIGPTS